MIKFIFYTFIAYVLFKIFRLFIDPMFEPKPSKTEAGSVHGNKSSTNSVPKSTLGEYVEYEEIK